MKIPGVYVEIKGDATQLKKDMAAAKQIVTESAKGMSNALNNALSPEGIKKGTNALISNLNQLSNSANVLKKTYNNIGVDLQKLQGITGTTGNQFAALQSRMLQVQGARAQEKSLRDIAQAANLTTKEIRALGAQFNVSHAGINRVVGATTSGASGMKGMAFAAGSLVQQMALMVGGFYAAQGAITLVSDEFKRGLSSVEDFNLTVAASAAYITTFSEKARSGDLAGGFEEANIYAGQLATKLEMIDSQTIASGKDLQIMSETFIQHGVLLDINNKKQVEGFTNIATALALTTAGQNKDIQMRQEINALLMGQIRATDRLPKLLANIDPQLKEHLELWKKEGTLIENVGKLLQGFSASTGELDSLWATVGSTMETIHNRILRGAFKPIFEDLIELAKDFNQSLMDTEGNLTPLAKGLSALVSEGYENGKDAIDAFDSGVLKLIYDFNLLTVGVRVFQSVVGGIKGAIEDFGSSDIEKASKEIDKLKEKLSGDKKWYEFSFLPDPREEARHADEIKGKITELQTFIASSESNIAELRRKSGGGQTAQVVALAKTVDEVSSKETKSRERAAEKAQNLLEDIEKKSKQSSLSALEYKKWALDQELKEMTKNAQGNKQALDQIAEYKKTSLLKMLTYDERYTAQQREAMEKYRDGWAITENERVEADRNAGAVIAEQNTKTASVITEEFSQAFESVQSSLADMIYEFDFSMDSILDIFKRMLAEMAAAIIMSGVKQAFLNMIDGNAATTMWGGLVSGVTGAFGSGNSSGGTVDASGAASGWGKVGGGLAVAGGAYGMYSGAQNMKNGNAGVGALQMGLGGVSAYKGAVTLGALKEGAATGAYKAIAAKMGLSTVSATGSTAAAYGTTSYTAGAGATSYGTFQAGASGAGAGSSGAGVGAGAAGAAAYAIPIAAAVLVAMGAYEKSQRPAAENQIDEAGITPAALGEFYAGWRNIQGTILETIPTLARYQTALYDANSQLLVATSETGTIALKYNESAAAGHQWGLELSVGSEEFRLAAEKSVSAFGAAGEGMGEAARLAAAERESMDVLSSALAGTATATEQMSSSLFAMSDAAAQTASQIGSAASGIQSAWGQVSDFSSHIAPVSYRQDDLKYHASGGIFTQQARIGNHVFGESGMEALIPLPSPDILSKIVDRLDRIESKQSKEGGFNGKVQVYIGNEQIYGKMRVVADTVAADRQASGVVGRAYI